MKKLLPVLALVLAAPLAHAQKARDFIQFEPINFTLVSGQEQVPAYYSFADTLKKPTLQLVRTTSVAVIGQFSPRWAVIKRSGGYHYFIRQSELAGLAPGQTVKQVADFVNAPLPIDVATKLINFTKVVQAPGVTKDELYARGKAWFATISKSARDVIQTDDKNAGILVGKGSQTVFVPTMLGMSVATKLLFTAKLAVKDGRYKYELTDYMFEAPSSQQVPNPPPLTAELVTSHSYKKDGTPSDTAKDCARVVSQQARSTEMELEQNMSSSKPAISTDF